MIDYNKPVRMKSGKTVEILSTYLMGDYPVLGKSVVGYALWEKDGSCLPEGNQLRDALENVPKEREIWLNIYKDTICNHEGRKEADKAACTDRVARVKVILKDYEGRYDE